ncbi:helix-turn-helix transcriptional regulator [Halobacillus sp. GSS1]|uniref:winged helix-turn-helix transcriptional regulator n=1 Tax=Halobacillus sp. GSS1 TaxID=2815919 RepID=UPI001A9073DA|nr:helix-turn-helix domain-containing protein [Halobacillus sp. GSS1]MBN9655427.1 helix-turn-helix transcriptional regulator [Halobacillus sp. GSS1]
MKQLQSEYQCAINLVIDLIGGKWKVLILWHLNEGDKRFNELTRTIPEITKKMLTQQLRELEGHGLVKRTVFEEVPAKVVYSTTDYGRNLQPVLYGMCQWGDDYAENEGIQMNSCWTGRDFMQK